MAQLLKQGVKFRKKLFNYASRNVNKSSMSISNLVIGEIYCDKPYAMLIVLKHSSNVETIFFGSKLKRLEYYAL